MTHRLAAAGRPAIVAVALVLGASVQATWKAPGAEHLSLSAAAARSPVARPPRWRETSNTATRLPLAFVENRGQADPRVRFYAQNSRFTFHFTRDAAMLSFFEAQPGTRGVTLALRFLDSNPEVVIEGDGRAPGAVNYLMGSDPSRWRTELPRYSRLVYRDLWPGIDLLLRPEAATLKYEFRIRPGARFGDIRLAYSGADRLALDANGGLLIHTALGELQDSAPVAYQDIAGARVAVDSAYALQNRRGEEKEFGFAISSAYSREHELIIDPGLDYSTLLGGSSDESAAAIAVDASGNAYITGVTQSPDFPTTTGAFDRTGAASNNLDVFVTKLNSTGTALVYSTFIGGSNFDWGRGLVIDSAGNAYVAGQTKSSDFPTTAGAFDRTFNIDSCPRCGIDQYDAFVAKLNATGSALVYSTFLGGFDLDDALAIAIDGSGNAYIGGETGSNNFPVTSGAFDTTRNGAFDAFVTKLNAAGSALVYSTYLGGLEVDFVDGAAVDASGNAYMAGITRSADFPTTPGAFDTTQNGQFDVFVTKLNPTGSALAYSTFLGGIDSDSLGGIAVDADANAYVAGATISPDYPTTVGAHDRTPAGNDAFVTKLDPAGATLLYSTLVGGSASDSAADVIVDGAGNVWIAGTTESADFPTTAGMAFDTTINGGPDAFLAQLDPAGSTLLHGTYIGGASSDAAADLAFDPGSNVIVAGETMSPDFPTTGGAFDNVFNGDPLVFWGDAFVAKFAVGNPLPPPPPAAPTLLSPANDSSPAQPVTFDWSDVSGAASYRIQIDDSSTFTTPLVVNQIVTASQFTAGALAGGTRHYWRVHGINSAGTAGDWSTVWRFRPGPAPSGPTLSSISLHPTSVVGGNTSQGTATLTSAAPSGGAVVALSSSNSTVASVPASVTVAAGATSATFTVTTTTVAASTSVTISGSYGGATRSAVLTVAPAPASAALSSISVTPTSVTGGTTSTGTATLTAAAPSGGAAVSLSSSNTAVASVPASVTIAAGATSANFTVTTSSVTASASVTITGTYNGVSKSTTLTVNPPAQNATLTVTATGRSGERVTSNPAGINVAVGSTQSAPFAVGTSITLSVSNNRDAVWSGACSSGGNKTKSCTFTLNANASVTANVQ